MQITRLFVTGYKNLVDCEIRPTGVHAITGCNGSGKSNLLEVLPFTSALLVAPDEARKAVLNDGRAPTGVWFPQVRTPQDARPLRIELDSDLDVAGSTWQVRYELQIPSPDGTYPIIAMGQGPGHLSRELITAKKKGAPGTPRTLLRRTENGTTSITPEKARRKRYQFRTRGDMSALHALQVREADDFAQNFPVLSAFQTAFLFSPLLRFDLAGFRKQLHSFDHSSTFRQRPGRVVLSYDPFPLLNQIDADAEVNAEFKYWLSKVGAIDSVGAEEFPRRGAPGTNHVTEPLRAILVHQHGRLLLMGELSMGGAAVLAFLIALYTFLRAGGAVFFEEPENHLHPKAIAELIRLCREKTTARTIVVSTHSPVLLNCLRPEEVTVMRPLKDEFVTTQNVSQIKEAIDALNRGFLSFGDLLQKDFAGA